MIVHTIRINGVAYPVEWITPTSWTLRFALPANINRLVLEGLDGDGNVIAGVTDVITITFTGTAENPADKVVINEIQYHPANEATQTEWIEFRSLQGVDVDIGNWRIEGGVDYTFPNGTIMPGGGHLVVGAIVGGGL